MTLFKEIHKKFCAFSLSCPLYLILLVRCLYSLLPLYLSRPLLPEKFPQPFCSNYCTAATERPDLPQSFLLGFSPFPHLASSNSQLRDTLKALSSLSWQ